MKYVTLLILIFCSCENSHKVKFIIPDNFTGVFRISESSQGKEVPFKDGFYIYDIGDSLHSTFKKVEPLEYVSYIEVETASGRYLKAWPPNSTNLEFHNLGITSEGNYHYGVFNSKIIDSIRKDGQYVFDIEKFNNQSFQKKRDN